MDNEIGWSQMTKAISRKPTKSWWSLVL